MALFFDDVHATKKFRLGTRVKFQSNEYIYLQGVASVVNGDWVTFDEDYVTTRAVANAKGRVAIANGAVDATTEFGWFTVYGKELGTVLTGFADNGNVFLTATAGAVDDAVVAGDAIHGAVGRGAISGTTALMELNYPMVLDITTF